MGRSEAPRTGRAREAAFTLLEVLLAVAISAVMLTAVAGFTAAARDASRTVRERSDERARTRSVLAMIEADLRALVAPTGAHAAGLVGEDGVRATGGDLAVPEAEEAARVSASRLGTEPPPYEARDRLILTIASGTPRFGLALPVGAGEIPEITYEIDDDPETPTRGLVRTVVRIRDPLEDAEAPEPEEVSPYVTGLDAEYLDAGSWQTSWDSASAKKLPSAVRLALSVLGKDGRLRRITLVLAPLCGREVEEVDTVQPSGQSGQSAGQSGQSPGQGGERP